ncbi:6-bladed beta-propeller [Algoriphagus limi]|uniref:6-bladed beta-propeller n=1 Tax=Algoriphagus limi TaxID=2975273 RepID=A0ABT2G7Y3_9BACT|nr:6-bladed beta-propeller [Algoriphagus limi]MCS5491351.1 6-bladed beta-propeller [Algoriphagus limi]
MIKRFYYILAIFSLNLIYSCNQNSSEEGDIHPIKIQSVASVENLSIKSARIVRFTENTFAPVGSVYKILAIQNRVILVDRIIGNAVIIFDDTGKYLNHIHRIGEGPGEYKNLENIYYDEKENVLILIPMDYRKKYFFDLDGNFIKEEKYNENIRYIDLLPSGSSEILINNGSLNAEDGFKVYENQELVVSAIPFVDYLDMTPLYGRNVISKIDRYNYNFTVGNRDTIFRYNAKSRKISADYIFDLEAPISKIDYGNHPHPLEYFVESQMYIGVFDIFQNEKFLSFTTFKYPGIKGRLLSKSTNRIYDTEELIHNKIGNIGFDGILGLSESGEFIAVLKPNQDGGWDFSKNKNLEAAFDEMGDLGPEEFLLLFIELEEIG